MQLAASDRPGILPDVIDKSPVMWTWVRGAPLKRIDKAKAHYIKARAEGRYICDLNDKPVAYFHNLLDEDNRVQGFKIKGPALKDHEFSVRILNEKGDETIMFDANIPEMVAKAERQFNEYLKRGWTPYVISRDGKTRRRITAFNAEMKEITFVEPGDEKNEKPFREKLSNFVKSFGVVQVLPKTAKG